MIKVIKISKGQLNNLVRLSYEGDTDMRNKFHSVVGSVEDITNETIEMIDNASKQYEMFYYKVLFDKEPIGYFVCGKQLLYSFAVAVKFRKKEILMKWWDNIKAVLGKIFTTVLYEHNTRAISFLEKQGMEVYKREGNLVSLINYQ